MFESITKSTPPSFSEYLFFTVLGDTSIPDTDIVKRFAQVNKQALEWPTEAASFEELERFFNANACRHLHTTVSKVYREMIDSLDFEAFVRLANQHEKQVEAALKSNLFALRTAWNDYSKAFPENS